MKKSLKWIGTVLALSLVLAGCGKTAEPEIAPEENLLVGETESEVLLDGSQSTAQTEIYLSAAASLTDVFGEIITEFETAHPEYKIIPNYGASGALQSQIEEGAPADIFFSAAEKQMNALEEGGYLLEGSRAALLENKVVLIVPTGSEQSITFDTLTDEAVKTIALGEPESVPVGQYSEEIFNSIGILDAVKEKAVYGSDVRTVLTWVESGEADCGLVYSTDAAISEKATVVSEAPEGSSKPIIYPVAQLKEGENREGAGVFLEFIKNDSSLEKFAQYGFTIVK